MVAGKKVSDSEEVIAEIEAYFEAKDEGTTKMPSKSSRTTIIGVPPLIECNIVEKYNWILPKNNVFYNETHFSEIRNT